MTKYTDMWERVEQRHRPAYEPYVQEMKKAAGMRELVLLGRGGQGAQMMGELLGSALVRMGKHVSVIFMNTGERRGTLTRSYIRYADAPVHFPVSNIYQPDLVVCTDTAVHDLVSLITDVDVPELIHNVGPDGILIVNSAHAPGQLAIDCRGRTATVDAARIALEVLGNEFHTNTCLLGTVAAATKVMDLAFLQQCIREFRNLRGKYLFAGAAGDANCEAARRGFEGLLWAKDAHEDAA